MAEIKEEVLTFISKIWVWLLYILIGLMAKFSYDLLIGKKITIWQALASGGIAFFIGFITSVICLQQDMERQGMWIVPCATLISDKIVLALMALDYKKSFAEILDFIVNKLKK